MRIVDCHVHVGGQVDPAEMIAAMDANAVDRMIILSRPERTSPAKTRENLLQTKAIFDAAGERVSALAWVNPTVEGMADLAAEALTEMGFSGLKIIPDHWYACDDRLQPFWARMNELEASILFHTGILYLWEDCSRFCRPVYLETLLAYPDIRFAMAHISWPWCEENLAVMGRMRAGASRGPDGPHPWQSYVDLTPGTPRHIRRQAVANAVEFCGPDRIMFGTDAGVPSRMAKQKELVDEYVALLADLGLDAQAQQRIMSGTADEVFPIRR